MELQVCLRKEVLFRKVGNLLKLEQQTWQYEFKHTFNLLQVIIYILIDSSIGKKSSVYDRSNMANYSKDL